MRQAERSSLSKTTRKTLKFFWVGDHPALDLLNTQYRAAGELTDALDGDRDVLAWLAEAGQPVSKDISAVAEPGALLEAARALRNLVRATLEQRKRGVRVGVRPLNEFLQQGASYLRVEVRQDGRLWTERCWNARTPAQILAPVAESAAELLADPAPELIRQCEAEDCVLWFYDRTKAHRRRWCSPATCGNRHKVASLRQRRREGK